MDSVQKYLKIIGRFHNACWNFARGCEIDFLQLWFPKGCEIDFLQLLFHKAYENFTRLWNSFSVLQALRKFILHSLALCPVACTPLGQFASLLIFRKGVAKLLDVRFPLWFSSLYTWLIWKRLRRSPKLGFFM